MTLAFRAVSCIPASLEELKNRLHGVNVFLAVADPASVVLAWVCVVIQVKSRLVVVGFLWLHCRKTSPAQKPRGHINLDALNHSLTQLI